MTKIITLHYHGILYCVMKKEVYNDDIYLTLKTRLVI